MKLVMRVAASAALGACLLLAGGCTSAPYPAETAEGLVRTADFGFDAVYRHPARELASIGAIRVEPCTVEFRENWLRDQNRERDIVNRVEPDDMRRIEDDLASACTAVFEEELETAAASDASAGGTGTVILKPRISELDVTAPDILSPSNERDYVRTTASMTLTVDLVDGPTGELLGRVIDHRSTPETRSVTRATRNANLVEIERLLRQWSSALAEYLARDHR